MNVRKTRDRFDTKPKLNKRGRPIRAAMKGRQPAVLQSVAANNTLSFKDVFAIVGGNERSLYRTIVSLIGDDYLRILPEVLRDHNYGRPLLYQLGFRGVEWLNANGYAAQQPRRVYNVGHTSLVSHTMASITAGVAATPYATFVSWEEMQQHPKFPPETINAADNTAIPHPTKGHIRPDTHPFGIILPNGEKQAYRFFVIEADNGTETIKPTKPAEYNGSSIYAKFEAYLDFIETKGFQARYGLPNYFVLFVFTSRARLDNAKALLASMRPNGSRHILFQTSNQVNPTPGYIFTSPCERVGYDPLFLNQP